MFVKQAHTFFLRNCAIRQKKLTADGTWECKLVPLGYYVDPNADTISIPDPEILGDINFAQSLEFNPGCRTPTIHALQDLRGCTNHWSRT